MSVETTSVHEVGLETAVEQAVAVLREGGLVVYPTDTSYGLACDPRLPDALSRLIHAKRRDPGVGVPLLFHDFRQCESYHDFTALERAIARLFWPGALTMVVSTKAHIPDQVTGGRPSVAVRVPDHDVPRAIARELGAPIVGTSANISGGPSPFEVSVAISQLQDSVDLYIDGGPSSVRQNSTIVGVDPNGDIRVYREGVLSISTLAAKIRVDNDASLLWTERFVGADM